MRLPLILLAALVMIAPGIFSLPPVDRDESRYIQATKQMVESGNAIDIRFQDATRYKKPVGIYWLQSLAVLAGGQGQDAPAWQYRTVSIAAILIGAAALFLTGQALFGAAAGTIAALAFIALFGVAFEGRIAKTDAMLLALAIVAQGALARLHLASRRNEAAPPSQFWLFWIAQGAAILIKGPIVPLLSLLTVAGLWLFERDLGWLRPLKPVRGLALAILIAAPWLIAITLASGGAFWSESLGTDMLGKAVSAQESHGAPPGYFVLSYMLYVWPLGPALLAAALALIGSMRKDPRLLFLFSWYVPFWLLCELIPTKLPHYMLPAYPALALALGWALTSDLPATRRRWQDWLRYAAIAGQVAITLVLAGLAVAGPIVLGGGISVAGIVAALAVLAAGWLGWRHASSLKGVALTAAAAALAYGLLFALVVPSMERMWLSPRIVAAMETSKACPDSVLASAPFHEPSLVVLAGTETVLTSVEGVAAHLNSDPQCALGLVPMERQDELAALVSPQELALLDEIEGVNYSNGRTLRLGLFRIAGERQ